MINYLKFKYSGAECFKKEIIKFKFDSRAEVYFQSDETETLQLKDNKLNLIVILNTKIETNTNLQFTTKRLLSLLI